VGHGAEHRQQHGHDLEQGPDDGPGCGGPPVGGDEAQASVVHRVDHARAPCAAARAAPASLASCSEVARRTSESSPKIAATQGSVVAGLRSAPAGPVTVSALDRRAASTNAPAATPGSAAASTACDESASKPARPSRLPSTRSTFQPGRVSPSGGTTALKLCRRPSALTKVPEVSVKGEIGNSTSLMSRLAL